MCDGPWYLEGKRINGMQPVKKKTKQNMRLVHTHTHIRHCCRPLQMFKKKELQFCQLARTLAASNGTKWH